MSLAIVGISTVNIPFTIAAKPVLHVMEKNVASSVHVGSFMDGLSLETVFSGRVCS